MTHNTLSEAIKRWALELGFAQAGICPAVQAAGFHRLVEWIARGYAGEMHYLEQRLDAYRHPSSILEHARSIVVMAMHYATAEPGPVGRISGRISRYAWGTQDYHQVMFGRMRTLIKQIQETNPACRARAVVDTAPLLEREYAQLSGLGWIGKHTLLLNRQWGSYFFLGAILLDVELTYDDPETHDYCGSCTACLDACPTQAFPAPYVLDATRCISYLTIEHRTSIAPAVRPDLGEWVFGCDVCQEVCPWNRRHAVSGESVFQPRDDLYPLDLVSLFEMDEQAFRLRFCGSPVWRAKRRGLLRNAAIALGNRPCAEALPALVRAIEDPEPLVRESAAWALGNHSRWPAARAALDGRAGRETCSLVAEAVSAALRRT